MLRNTKTMGKDGTHARRFIPAQRSCSQALVLTLPSSKSHRNACMHGSHYWSCCTHQANASQTIRRSSRRFSFHYSNRFVFQLRMLLALATVNECMHTDCPYWIVCVCVLVINVVVVVAAIVVAIVLCSESLVHSLVAAMRKKGNANVRYAIQTQTTYIAIQREPNQARICSLLRSFVHSFVRSFGCMREKSNIRISFPKCMFWMRPSRSIQWLRLKATGRIPLHADICLYILS